MLSININSDEFMVVIEKAVQRVNRTWGGEKRINFPRIFKLVHFSSIASTGGSETRCRRISRLVLLKATASTYVNHDYVTNNIEVSLGIDSDKLHLAPSIVGFDGSMLTSVKIK